jgi:hypothetical protein
MPQVAQEILKPWQTTLIANCFHHLRLTPCLDSREAHGFFVTCAMEPGLLSRQFEMDAQFLLYLTIARAKTHSVQDPHRPFAKDIQEIHSSCLAA